MATIDGAHLGGPRAFRIWRVISTGCWMAVVATVAAFILLASLGHQGIRLLAKGPAVTHFITDNSVSARGSQDILILFAPPPPPSLVPSAQFLAIIIAYVNPFIAGLGLIATFYRLHGGRFALLRRGPTLRIKLFAALLVAINISVLCRLPGDLLPPIAYPALLFQTFAASFAAISLCEARKQGSILQ